MPEVSLGEVRLRLHELLLQAGVLPEHARIIEDHYLGNEVLGKPSHGVFRLPGVVKQLRSLGPGGPLRPSGGSEQTLRFDANQLPGVVACTLVADQLADRIDAGSPQHSLAAAGVANYQFGTGVVGRYAFQLAERGLVAIVMANSPAYVAPPGGREPLIGTNPIALAVPTNDMPLVIDVATSATSYGALSVAQMAGQKVKTGLVIDAQGKPSTDPADKDAGAMLAMAEHKGFGLGLMVDLLAGALIGADSGPVGRTLRKDGTLIIAMRPDAFDATDVIDRVTAMQETIATSAPRPGFSRVRTPGASYAKLRNPRGWPATINVDDPIWQAFCAL